MTPTFEIWFETEAGVQVKAFTWTRDEASGIARAKRDAKLFNIKAARFWAVAV